MDDIQNSFPTRNLQTISPDERVLLHSKTDSSSAHDLITSDSVLRKVQRLKRNRAPGIDGFTAEHLNRLLMGGNRQIEFKK